MLGQQMKFDVYRGKADRALRLAVRSGEGLPRHVDPAEWEIMPPGASVTYDRAEEDIKARGFCFYKLA